ncbi:MAG: cation:proton antiporter [Gammaproteobacteria bacterium]|nr:cation:proton antiporter [Gammaproteobacteria bacterium]
MDDGAPLIHIIFLIFSGTAVLATLALFTRQSLLVAYMALGALFGPWGFKFITNSALIEQSGDVGIIFLLFLLGLDLQPKNLLHSLRKMNVITLISSLIFFIVGFGIAWVFHFTLTECLIAGAAVIFSSTIIGLKLLPTTILHHQHTGELMISILLLQDIIAIIVLLALQGIGDRVLSFHDIGYIVGAFPLLILIGYLFQRFVLGKLLMLFDRVHEYIFILSIGWCLCMAELSHYMGLSGEIGAFIAGISLATHPVSLYVAESLKPLRDFFLVIFFFSIGAGFNFSYLSTVILPAAILAVSMLALKPFVFSQLLSHNKENSKVSKEVGVRLGQLSEFSLLIISLAVQAKLASAKFSYTLQAATILTFIVSCYWVVMRYPTPLATTDNLRRN